MRGVCSKCGEAKVIVAIGRSAEEDEIKQLCKECAEEEGYIKPYSQVETKGDG